MTDDRAESGASPPRRRRWPIWAALLLAGVTLLWFLLAGRVLVAVDDEAVRSDVVVVPSGDVLGNRLLVGAQALLETGTDRLIVFTQGEGPLYSGGKEAADLLDAAGVDPAQVRLLPPGGSTSEEAATFAALAHRCDWRTVTMVTSPYHSRRAGWLFRRALGFPTIVRVIGNAEPFEAETWWTDDAATELVLLEWTKILASAKYLLVRPEGVDPGVPC